MSTETKQASLEKLSKLKICVGRPTKWPSTAGQWADLNWETADLSTLYASRSMWAYQTHVIQEFYRPVDRNLWAMRAYEVNACYDLNMNQMIIPAGIIQKPFFGHTKVSRNFGALGSVIGHELTHGFDDQGRKFNPDGNLVPWWNSSDIKEYEHRAAKVRNYYASLSFMGMPVNGKLTLGENLADIGGLTLSLRALERANGALKPADYRAFFKAYAVLWRLLITKKAAKKSNLSNPHAPDKFRVNGVVTHMVEFYRAYGHQLNPQQIKKLHSYSIW
jgi:putative endopeptidase